MVQNNGGIVYFTLVYTMEELCILHQCVLWKNCIFYIGVYYEHPFMVSTIALDKKKSCPFSGTYEINRNRGGCDCLVEEISNHAFSLCSKFVSPNRFFDKTLSSGIHLFFQAYPLCVVCQIFAGIIDTQLEMNKTVEEISDIVFMLCGKLDIPLQAVVRKFNVC